MDYLSSGYSASTAEIEMLINTPEPGITIVGTILDVSPSARTITFPHSCERIVGEREYDG
jgi:hypothetical protein